MHVKHTHTLLDQNASTTESVTTSKVSMGEAEASMEEEGRRKTEDGAPRCRRTCRRRTCRGWTCRNRPCRPCRSRRRSHPCRGRGCTCRRRPCRPCRGCTCC